MDEQPAVAREFIATNSEYHFVAVSESMEHRYTLYRVHRWSNIPAEIVAQQIDLSAARTLAGSAS